MSTLRQPRWTAWLVLAALIAAPGMGSTAAVQAAHHQCERQSHGCGKAPVSMSCCCTDDAAPVSTAPATPERGSAGARVELAAGPAHVLAVPCVGPTIASTPFAARFGAHRVALPVLLSTFLI